MPFSNKQDESTENHRDHVPEILAGLSISELLATVRSYQTQYGDLARRAFEEHDWVSGSYFEEMLEHAYPDANYLQRRNLAFEIEELIHTRLGKPERTVSLCDITDAEVGRRVALTMLADQLTDNQISDLEQQARRHVQPDDFPEDFDDNRAWWLATWAARGLISLSTHGTNDVAA